MISNMYRVKALQLAYGSIIERFTYFFSFLTYHPKGIPNMARAKLLKRADHKTMLINPDHVVSMMDHERGSCTVTLSTGNSYVFNESSENVALLLWGENIAPEELATATLQR